MISKNIKRMGEINKEIPELVKKAYDKSIKPELQIN